MHKSTWPSSDTLHWGMLALIIASFLLSGCSTQKKRTYDDGELRQVHAILEGTIINVGQTRIKEDPALLGPIVGGVAGGAIGTVVASTTGIFGSTRGAIFGATAGAILAGADNSAQKTYRATELTIELNDGSVLLIVLGNDEYFVRGDLVRVISLGKNIVRVQHK